LYSKSQGPAVHFSREGTGASEFRSCRVAAADSDMSDSNTAMSAVGKQELIVTQHEERITRIHISLPARYPSPVGEGSNPGFDGYRGLLMGHLYRRDEWFHNPFRVSPTEVGLGSR